MREKYNNKSNESTLSANNRFNMKLDGDFCIVIISVDPDKFHKIKLVNKQFVVLSGFEEVEL